MKNPITIIFTVIILAVGVTQAQENKPIHAPCKYIAQSGWRVPCLGKVSKTKSFKNSVVENVVVQGKKHKLKAENLVGVEGCRTEGKETKEARNKPFAVREFISYEVNKKIFAYGFTFTYILVNSDNGIEYAAAQYTAYYFDEDGDGKFEIRCHAKGLENLPTWVKTSALSKQ